MSSPKLPSIPISTEKNVKLMLDSLAGRMDINRKALTIQDLVNMGIISASGQKILQQLPPSFGQEDIVFPEIPTGYLPDKPTTPTQLATNGSWGAIFLTWEYAAYNAEYGTEIHRSKTNDRNTAELIGVATGRDYTDNVGEKETYFYWVRNRNFEGNVSGFNELGGTQGDSNLLTTAEDFLLANPEAEFQPFTIANYGTDLDPDWKILLNGQVIITSDLSIGQLLSGEMRPNTTFTVGNGSLEIGTDSGGAGYINVAGDGGINGNDYLRITDGSIKSYIWSNGQHVNYKELRRIERGQAGSGDQVIIPKFFKSEPTVYLSPHNMPVYSAAHSGQDQSLILAVGDVLRTTTDGEWWFRPTAGLFTAANIETKSESGTYTGSGSGAFNSPHDFVDAYRVTVSALASSYRNYDSTSYRNRQTTLYVYARTAGTNNAWGNPRTIVSKDHGDTTASMVISATFDIAKGDWEFRYELVSEDTATFNTFNSSGEEFVYYNGGEGKATVTSGNTYTLNGDVNGNDAGQYIEAAKPPSGTSTYTLYKIKYTFVYSFKVEVWGVNNTDWLNPIQGDQSKSSFGSASGAVPEEESKSLSTGYNSNESYPPYVTNGYPPANTDGYEVYEKSNQAGGHSSIDTSLSSSDITKFLSGKWSYSKCTVSGSTSTSKNYLNEKFGTGKSSVTIHSYKVDYYFRKASSVNTTATNSYQPQSISVSLGEANTPISGAVINWMAVGE